MSGLLLGVDMSVIIILIIITIICLFTSCLTRQSPTISRV